MKKSTVTKILFTVVMSMILVMTGCGNAEKTESQAKIDESIVQDQNGNAQAEEKKEEATPEPTVTPEPTATPEPVVIDERYEYHLYDMTESAEPVIGINAPEGWEKGNYGGAEDRLFSVTLHDPSWKESINIDCGLDPYEHLVDEDELFSKEEKATIMTPFGETKIYWYRVARRCDKTYESMYERWEDEKKYEEEGIKYIIYEQEVGYLTVREHKVVFSVSGESYEGRLEELLPQMLEAK